METNTGHIFHKAYTYVLRWLVLSDLLCLSCKSRKFLTNQKSEQICYFDRKQDLIIVTVIHFPPTDSSIHSLVVLPHPEAATDFIKSLM